MQNLSINTRDAAYQAKILLSTIVDKHLSDLNVVLFRRRLGFDPFYHVPHIEIRTLAEGLKEIKKHCDSGSLSSCLNIAQIALPVARSIGQVILSPLLVF